MAEPGDVSVVIPAFNEEEGIAAVVAAVLARRPWREVLVVDDGSTDRTAERAAGGGGARACAIPTTRATARRSRPASARPGARSCCSWTRTASTTPRTPSASWPPIGLHDMVIGARAAARPARDARPGQRGLQDPGLLAHRAGRSPTSPPASAPRAATGCSRSCTCCPTASRIRPPRAWPSSRPATTWPSSPIGPAARRPQQDPVAARRRALPAHHLQDRHPLQPAQGLLPHQRGRVRPGRRLRRLERLRSTGRSPWARRC